MDTVNRPASQPHVEIIESGLWIPVGSSCKLAARMWLPADAGSKPVPALLEFLPYRKRDLTRGRDEPIHHFFAASGYASLRVDMRGSGDSFGVMRDEYELQEQEDAVAVIEWLSRQTWCTGRVGMFGISWGGFNALQIAARRPPALRAIITSCSSEDRYSDDMHYMGGCLLNDNLDWATNFFSMLPLPGDSEIMGPEWRANWRERLAAIEPLAERWMRHQVRDSYWKQGSLNGDYDAIECPVFAAGGWLDGYSNTVPRLLANLKAPCLGVVGPHAHQFGFEDRAPGPTYDFLAEAVRWWDYWLKDKSNGIMDEPKLRVFMGDDIPARAWYPECPGRWISESQWPSPRIERVVFHLNSTCLHHAPTEGPPLRHTSPQTVGLQAGEWCPYGTGGCGPEFPGDQRLDDALSLTFDSDVLTDRLDILGAPVLDLDLSVDQERAFLAIRLNDVKPDGSATRVSYGILNLTHRYSRENPQPVEPSKRFSVRMQLNDAAYSFGPGHRLRISISTTYWPVVWPSPRPVELSLFPGTSRVSLPVRPQQASEPQMRRLSAAPVVSSMAKTQVEPAPNSLKVTHDRVADRIAICAERGSGFFVIEDNQIETGRNVFEHLSIVEGDPLSASSEISVRTRTGRRDRQLFNVTARSHLTADADFFYLSSNLDIEENEENVFSRAWKHTIPRKYL